MRGLIGRAVAAVAGAAVLAAGMVTVAAGAAAAATVTGVEAPLPANAASNQGVDVHSVSCASAGNCTAVGGYADTSGNGQGLLLTQTAGTWTAAEAPLPANAASNPGEGQAFLNSVSCASAGNCTAVGGYNDSSGNGQGLLLTETAGTWTAAEARLPPDAASFSGPFLASVSCASAGNCTAVGHYTDTLGNTQGLLLTQTAGTWTTVEAPLPANAASNPGAVFPVSVSCASAGNCTAVGDYNDSSSNEQGLLLTQTAGTWTAAEAPMPAGAESNPFADLRSVSCASAGNCIAIGQYTDSSGNELGLLLTQTAGTWTAAEAPLPADVAPGPGEEVEINLNSVSCASAGNCTAVGTYDDTSGIFGGLLLTQTAGTWTAAEAPRPANAASSSGIVPLSVSCASAGNCTAAGIYDDTSENGQGLLLTQTAGTWTAAEAPLPAGAGSDPGVILYSVSCASAGNCTAVGPYTDSSGNVQGLLVTQTQAAGPDLSLSDTAPATAVSGQPYRYTLVATNTGGSDATKVVVADALPASAHFDSASTTRGSCTRTSRGSPATKGGTVICKVGSLAAGASVTVTIKVTPTKPGKISDAATVTASNVTPDSDDTASAPVTVHGT